MFKPGTGFSRPVVKLVKPIYLDLIKADELSKCLLGKTQNQNESYNGTLWERIPKSTYVGIDKLRLGVYDSIVNFNDGRQGTIDIFTKLGMNPGRYTTLCCYLLNKRRRLSSKYKMSQKVRRNRKSRSIKKNVRGKPTKKVVSSTSDNFALCYDLRYYLRYLYTFPGFKRESVDIK